MYGATANLFVDRKGEYIGYGPESAELVGAWGIQIHWNDGHETGIYAWSMLRVWRE